MAGIFTASSFRMLGNAATPHNLLTIENIDPTKLVTIRRITVQMDATAVLTSVSALFKASRAAAIPTGGTVLNKGVFDTSNSSNANTIVRAANASDGGAATVITATAGTAIWSQYHMRLHTAVGQVLSNDELLLPNLLMDYNFILRQNQALLIQVVAPAGTSNPATNHYVVQVTWEED
jgi:hypothetical protein